MRLISNTEIGAGHFAQLDSLFRNATSATLMSPFLSEDLAGLLGNFELCTLDSLHLITTLKPKSLEQLRKIDSIISVYKMINGMPNVMLKISINNQLHGKVYLFHKNESPIGAIVTSANLTESGLRRNHEWGVLIEDKELIEILLSSIDTAANYTDITYDVARKLQAIANDFRDKHGDSSVGKGIDLDLTTMLQDMNLEFVTAEGTQIWLKPLGIASDPVAEGTDFSEKSHDIYFSKKRPSGIRIGDYIIAYAVGTGRILSYFRAESEPTRIPDNTAMEDRERRWPWYITCSNKSRIFGKRWWLSELAVGNLLHRFLAIPDQEAVVTAAGRKTLGTLNYGSDKVRLSNEFGAYLISQIKCAEK